METIKVLRKHMNRIDILNKLYDLCEGSVSRKLHIDHLEIHKGTLSEDEFLDIIEYLKMEGLIQTYYSEGNLDRIGKDDRLHMVQLVHEGLKEIEQARNVVDEPTKHFKSINMLMAKKISDLDSLSIEKKDPYPMPPVKTLKTSSFSPESDKILTELAVNNSDRDGSL